MTSDASQLAALAMTVKTMGQFEKVRVLPDGSIAAIGNLLFTRAIHLGCTVYGWERRFCFEDRARADSEFEKLASEDDTPTGWVANRISQRAMLRLQAKEQECSTI